MSTKNDYSIVSYILFVVRENAMTASIQIRGNKAFGDFSNLT